MLIGIYPRKLIFFAVLALAGFGLFKFGQVTVNTRLAQSLVPKIAADVADNANQATTVGDYYLEINLLEDGTMMIGDKELTDAVKSRSDRDELRYIVLDQPLESYNNVEIVVNLPQKINRLLDNPEIIAVHGATPIGSKLEDQRIVYRAKNIYSSATVTIAASFPKGYFNLPATKFLSGEMAKVPGYVWLIGGVTLPPIAGILLLFMLFRSGFQIFEKKVEGTLEFPPSDLSPALVSVLDSGRVGPRTIMAILVDLARRGFIEIYNRGNDFVIYRREKTERQLEKLSLYEALLLEKIFLPKQKKVGTLDVEARIARHLFSRKIAVVYLYIYNEMTGFGYFSEPPARRHLRYRMIGITTFFLGLLGYALFAIFSPDPKYMLFTWLALVLFGVVMVRFSPRLTTFTPRGEAVREQWLKFKNYLSYPKVIKGRDELFEKYLPYAVAMGCEDAWAARFVEANFVKPPWYESIEQLNGVENFAKSLLPIIDYIGDSLSLASDPMVK